MTDKKQILTRALAKLAPPSLRDKTRGEKIPVPKIEDVSVTKDDALDTFTVSLPPPDKRFDKVIFCVTDPQNLRGCTLQDLNAVVLATSDKVSEAFSNTSLEQPFGPQETVTALCFLHDQNTDSWVATDESSGFTLFPSTGPQVIRET